MADNSSVQSVERTFDIIENLSSAPQGLTLLELSSDVGLPKSTVHRLLSTLTGRGYITQDPESKKYLLTLKLFEISSRSLAGFDILSAARPYLQHLSRITNEAVHLVVREGHEVVYIYKEDSSKNTVRMASHIGLHNPMYCTGVGKAIMAYLPRSEQKQIWKATEIIPYTDKTITDYELMLKELDHIKECGYAIDDEEHENDVCCAACPIFDYTNMPYAAISISAPRSRMDNDRMEHRIIPELLTATRRISGIMGCPEHS